MTRAQAERPVDAGAADMRADAEVVLLERLAFERLLADLSERFADVGSADFLGHAEGALRRLVAFLGYDRCTFAELVAGDYLNVLCSAATVGLEPLPRGRFQYLLPWFLAELRAGRIVAMSNLPDDLPPAAIEESEHCRRTGLRSHLSIPLRIGGRVTSVLSFGSMRSTRTWPADMVARLKIVGEVLGSAMTLARTEEEARLLRRRVWHADRVGRVSALTAAIAHELNQPLAAILSNAQAGLKYLARGDADLGMIQGILEDVVRDDKRAAETIRTMRALIRQDEAPRERTDLAAALREMLRLLESEFAGQGVRIETQFDAGCWVMADRAQIEQVGLNLMLNAAAALQARPPGQRIVRLCVSRREDGAVVMAVRDAGKGIAPRDLETIFEPFWTTRQEGLGLGLAICRSIVESHGGRIWAESNVEGGATFSVELPAAAQLPDDADAPATAIAREGASVRAAGEQSLVCVIDDDPAVRDSLMRLLEAAGSAVACYASAEAFLDHPPAGDVACLLLDIRMPGLSGPELQQRLLEQGGAPPIVFLTGHGEVSAGVDAMKLGAADFLVKPVDGEVLFAAVRRAVERYADERRRTLALDALKERIGRLSAREREIMEHVVSGGQGAGGGQPLAGNAAAASVHLRLHRANPGPPEMPPGGE
ncbi:MAG: response regulator [Variovorax sp.]|nr:MAG: response regulator [Variovorax sp.]